MNEFIEPQRKTYMPFENPIDFPYFEGYVGPDGTLYTNKSKGHDIVSREIIYNTPNLFKSYLYVPVSFFDQKPTGMLQEEYFLINYLKFAKISYGALHGTQKILIRYHDLTPEQIKVIYPQ